TRLLRGRDSASAFVLTMMVLVLFLGPLTALAFSFTRQAAELAGRLQVWLAGQRDTTLTGVEQYPVVGRALQWLEENPHISAAQIQTWAVEGSKTLFQELASYGGIAFMGAVGTVLAFTVMLFILFFIIRDGRAIARTGSALV